ncbi:glycosaminoglycan attachment site [Yersinia enterocolitica]
MDLFTPVTTEEKLHPIFKLLTKERYGPERDVLKNWSEGFIDRDGKFVHEFQTTFESSLWELYLYACLKKFSAEIDFAHHAPDFVTNLENGICIEATIAAPAQGGKPPMGKFTKEDLPFDFGDFNAEATIRICNSISSKLKKYQQSYSNLSHVKNKPFVIALASFDRPHSQFAANRPLMAAVYGLYYDEAAALAQGAGATKVPSVFVNSAIKENGAEVPIGIFNDDRYSDISAIIYSPVATWGKIRALADNPTEMSMYTTIHPNSDSIFPVVRVTKKSDYVEDLLDGMYVLHNPFAKNPISSNTFNHERIAQIIPHLEDDFLEMVAPDDFLLTRFLGSMIPKEGFVDI